MRFNSAFKGLKKCHRKAGRANVTKISDETFSINEVNTQELQTE
jgi:hypothetical protein